jgi:hypothetical protein
MAWPGVVDQIQTIKQCWFLGTHGSVGGGTEQMSNNIANITLRWMCAQLQAYLGVGIDQQNLNLITRLPQDAALFGIRELENSFQWPMSAAGSFRRTPGVPDPDNQRVHITVRLWDRYLTLNQRPSILDQMFQPGDPVMNAQDVYEWTTTGPQGRVLLEEQPNAVERAGLVPPHALPPGPPVMPSAQGGVASHYGDPYLPFNTTQPPITHQTSHPGGGQIQQP